MDPLMGGNLRRRRVLERGMRCQDSSAVVRLRVATNLVISIQVMLILNCPSHLISTYSSGVMPRT